MFKSTLGKIVFLFIIWIQTLLFIENSIAASVSPCGELTSWYGPYDYTNPNDFKEKLPIVEKAHFTPKVENLVGGQNAITPLGDLSYVLWTFPNHHRALNAVSRYEIREMQKSRKGGTPYDPKAENGLSAECYFDRAIRWRPNDPNVYLIYGIHLHRLGKLDQALNAYKTSEKIQPNSADLQNNMGLVYFDMKNYALAKEHAKKAYQLGYPLPGLRKKLASVGQWP